MSVIGKVDVSIYSVVDNRMTIAGKIKTVFDDYPIKERGIIPRVDKLIFERSHYTSSGRVIDHSDVVTILTVEEFFFNRDDGFYLRFTFTYDNAVSKDIGKVVTNIEPVNLINVYKWNNIVGLEYTGDPDYCIKYANDKLKTFQMGSQFYRQFKTYTIVRNMPINGKTEPVYGRVFVVGYTGTELPPTTDIKYFIESIGIN